MDMHTLKTIRRQRGLSQARLAESLGVSRQRLSDWEGGRRKPGSKHLASLHKILELGGEQPVALPSSVISRTNTSRPWRMETDNSSTWAWSARRYPDLMARHKHVDLPGWFKAGTRCDSSLEYSGWVQFQEAGARPHMASPLVLGYDHHVLLDYLERPLGTRMRPCLHWRGRALEAIAFPQIMVRPDSRPFRVDALVLVRYRGRSFWCTVEIDGEGHNPTWDAERERALGLPVVRLVSADVIGMNFAGILLERLREVAERQLRNP